VIAFEQSGRIDEVGAPHRIQNVGHRDVRGQQLRGIGRDVKLRFLPALDQHGRYTIEPVQPRLDLVGCHLPKLCLRRRVGA
jgi:hypothetical protein